MPKTILRHTSVLSSVLIALLLAPAAHAGNLWDSSLSYPPGTSANGSNGGNTASGGNGQNISEIDMTNAAVNTSVAPIPSNGGFSTSAPVSQAYIQSGDQVILSQSVSGGTGGSTSLLAGVGGIGGNASSIQDWTENNAASTSVTTAAFGGLGGNSLSAEGGAGGNATASSTVSVNGNLSTSGGVTVTAQGGNAGNSGSGVGGNGGAATATGSGTATGSNGVNVTVSTIGGAGSQVANAGSSGNGGVGTSLSKFNAKRAILESR